MWLFTRLQTFTLWFTPVDRLPSAVQSVYVWSMELTAFLKPEWSSSSAKMWKCKDLRLKRTADFSIVIVSSSLGPHATTANLTGSALVTSNTSDDVLSGAYLQNSTTAKIWWACDYPIRNGEMKHRWKEDQGHSMWSFLSGKILEHWWGGTKEKQDFEEVWIRVQINVNLTLMAFIIYTRNQWSSQPVLPTSRLHKAVLSTNITGQSPIGIPVCDRHWLTPDRTRKIGSTSGVM